jgi:hypothetical protein
MDISQIDTVLNHMNNDRGVRSSALTINAVLRFEYTELIDILEFLEDEGFLKKRPFPDKLDASPEKLKNIDPIIFWQISLKGIEAISEGGISAERKAQNRDRSRLFVVQICTIVIASLASLTFLLKCLNVF